MATREEISNFIKDILAEEFECERESINDSTNLFTELDLDSIDAVDLVVRLQQQTKKRVNPEDFKKIRTFGEVVDVVEKLVNE
ncbi:MAG: acyl carrier protein [Verrucomicrobiaceae bacterium]|jgi:acyl carrier protein|nr:acyl carrier protein [Verrucomicrobiaceae bacterium]